ncbi:MAG: leucine--tRNA ligase [Patescibacteria group bacterium]
MKYTFTAIEKKWQKEWERHGLYEANDRSKKKKWYSLFEFPYPSGDGLHVGHLRPYIGMDIISRKRRMEGYNVLFPIGWDAFGLPTENYAIKTGIAPHIVTKKNTDTFRRQIKSIGASLDWDREINTSDSKYYRWTQWMFLQFLKHDLAYKAEIAINWCLSCKIGLANEEVVGGKCERCGSDVEKRTKKQWMLKITAYAEKLLDGLEKLDFLKEIKTQQINWIGKSEGAELKFALENGDESITVFTTRPDTIFGATYLVLAPEHNLVYKLALHIKNLPEVEAYQNFTRSISEQDRVAEGKEKTGVVLGGIFAINPATGNRIPVWIADYVMAHVGTGAIMAVPAHDERDFEFAKKFQLPIVQVIKSETVVGECWTGEGSLIDSGGFTGMSSLEARRAVTKFLGGKLKTHYKLRDWVFSRQRYWGEPIPVIICASCGYVPVPEKNLPVVLPKVKNYKPREDGESPLASVASWVKVKCPKCKGPAERETDTMPNWAGSSWYFLRYADSKNKHAFADTKKLEAWMPVDWYNGGMEHVTLHLLYSRFWNLFLYDIGEVPTAEPYKKRTAHGLILAEGGAKMSKSKGNVVSPDGLIKEFGADALRVYEMFMGPFDQAIAWDPRGILGASRFLERVWNIGMTRIVSDSESADKELTTLLHKTIKKVSEDIETMSFNTAISAMMIFINGCGSEKKIPVSLWSLFVRILAPFAPHVAEELYQKLTTKNSRQKTRKISRSKLVVVSSKSSVHLAPWPSFNPKLITEETFELIIQVNGKFRGTVTLPRGVGESEAKEIALKDEKVLRALDGKQSKKVVFVPDRLINFII